MYLSALFTLDNIAYLAKAALIFNLGDGIYVYL